MRKLLKAALGGQLRAGTVGGIILKCVNLGLSFGSAVILTRWLGAESYGSFTLAKVIAGIVTVPLSLGLTGAAVRFVSRYRSDDMAAKLRGFIRFSSGTLLLVGLAGALVFALSSGLVVDNNRELEKTLIVSAGIIPLLLTLRFGQRTLQGYDRPIYGQLGNQVVKHGAFIALAGALWFQGVEAHGRAYMAMYVWLAALVGAVSVTWFLARQTLGSNYVGEQAKYEITRWLRTSWPMALSDSLGLAYRYGDIAILGVLAAQKSVGIYEIGYRVGGVVALVLSAANIVLAPRFAQLTMDSGAHNDGLQALLRASVRPLFIAGGIVWLLLAISGDTILAEAFGPEYVSAFPIVMVLGTARLIDIGCGPVVTLLNMGGEERIVTISIAITGLLNVVLTAIFVSTIGVVGAAVASGVSMVINNVFLLTRVRTVFGVDSSVIGGALTWRM